MFLIFTEKNADIFLSYNESNRIYWYMYIRMTIKTFERIYKSVVLFFNEIIWRIVCILKITVNHSLDTHKYIKI